MTANASISISMSSRGRPTTNVVRQGNALVQCAWTARH
jgi:hypothetical protein